MPKPTPKPDDSVPRSAGQDPSAEVKPHPAESEETPSATATPPQEVQAEKANQPGKKEKTYRVRILRGIHLEGGKTYEKGDVVESRTDLVGRFGTEKFESVDAVKPKPADDDD